MTATPKFKIGDRVRTTRTTTLEAGTEFTITGIVRHAYMTPARCARLGFGPYYATGDEAPDGIWFDYLELVEPAPAITFATFEEPKCDRHIAHIEDLQDALTIRNARIKRQTDIINAQKEQLKEYARQLEATPADDLEAMLRTFHDAFGVPRDLRVEEGDIDPELLTRHHMLQEEVNEFLLALAKGDIVGAADALGDVIYVAAGTADRLGIPIMRVLHSIQKANMDKLDPVTGKPVPHPTIPGKIGKPEGWRGPEAEIEEILTEEGLL